jgi:hypothetical protein
MARWLAAAHAEGVKANLEVAKDIQAMARILVPKRTGALAAAIDASSDGDDALVGPTGAARSKNGPYGRAVELGGMRSAHNPSGYMWWMGADGILRRARSNMMPSQPYLKPAAELIESGGAAKRIYYDAWLKAQQTV